MRIFFFSVSCPSRNVGDCRYITCAILWFVGKDVVWFLLHSSLFWNIKFLLFEWLLARSTNPNLLWHLNDTWIEKRWIYKLPNSIGSSWKTKLNDRYLNAVWTAYFSTRWPLRNGRKWINRNMAFNSCTIRELSFFTTVTYQLR